MWNGTQLAAILFVLAVTIHNLEEWIWLPGFSWSGQKPTSSFAFRFAVVAITIFFWAVLAGFASGLPMEGVLAGFAVAMLFNAAVPHLAASIWLRRYHPGAATAWILVAPAAFNVLVALGAANRLREPAFALTAAAGVGVLAASVPLLILMGRSVERRFARE